MSELNCNKCLYYELDGDELPCRICTLEKDFFRPDPAKMKPAPQDTPEPDNNDDDTSGEGGASAEYAAEDAYEISDLFVNNGVLHVHFHFHTEGGACSA